MYGPGALLAGRYRLEERVGAGGMGEVWRATDERLGRMVAVKFMHPALLTEPGFLIRFRAEARILASIRHPGVVAVHDYLDEPTGAFLVMDYVDGEPLSQLIARVGRLPAARTMELMAQAAEALHAAHLAGVTHRDVKPANLLVRTDGTVLLTDFGIARTEAGPQLTATGAVVGTPSYLAPEQVLGVPASPLTDVYALGLLAYECLTGQRPFDRENPFATAMARVRDAPPTLTGDVPAGVAAVVERAIAVEPSHRWHTAAELAAACRRAVMAPHGPPAIPQQLPIPPSTPPAPPPYAAMSPSPRSGAPHRRGLALATAGGAIGVVALVTGLVVAATIVANVVRDRDDGGGPTGGDAAPASAECAPFADYQGHDGGTVSVLSAFTGESADRLEESLAPFTGCTGIAVEHTSDVDVEPRLRNAVASGTPPDIALLPRPGLLAELAQDGSLVPVPAEVAERTDGRSPAYRELATVEGQVFGTPFAIELNSLVWYSPRYFTDHGYRVPQTWQEMLELSGTIAATGVKPWCAGIESGAATGWPVAFWVGDAMLRVHGPAVYEQWWRHEIRFDDPRVVEAMDLVGGILKNPDYVNGGHGGVASIVTTTVQDAGLPILDGECALYRQGSYYANMWPSGTTIGEDGDVWAFYLPPVDPAAGRPAIGNGELAVALADRPEVAALQTYLAGPDWAAARTALGGFIPAHPDVDPAQAADPVDRLAMEVLQAPGAAVYFGPLDLMPSEVLVPFWKGMTDWVNGQDSQTVAAAIERDWP